MSPLVTGLAAVVAAVLVLLAAAVVVQSVRLGRCARRCEDLTRAFGDRPRPALERRYLTRPPDPSPTAHRRPVQGRAAADGRHSAPHADHNPAGPGPGWTVLAPDVVELYRRDIP